MPSARTNESPQATHNAREERLKKKYYRLVGPPVFREVRVADHGADSEYRWVDAVHILGIKRVARFEVRGDRSRQRFRQLVSGRKVEVIEAKRKLNRSVIGQALVAKHLFEFEYPKARAVFPVVICEESDVVLKKVCDRMGIKVKAFPLRRQVKRAASSGLSGS